MLKGCTLIDLNAHVQIPSLSQEKPNIKQTSKEKINSVGESMPYKELLITEEAIEKKKKRRIILKSREKFPSDFFNENKEDLGAPRRQNTSPCNDYERLRPRRANSTSVEGTASRGTPKFSSNMAIFLGSRPFGKGNSNNMYTEGTWSKIPIEETEVSDVSLNTPLLKPLKYNRSQSLVDPSTVGEPSLVHESNIFNDSRTQVESKKMYKDLRHGQNVPRNVIRHHSVQKSRPVHSPGIPNHPHYIMQIKPDVINSCKPDPELKDNISISTDVSSKVPSREAPSNRLKTIESPQIYPDRNRRSKTPDKLLHLPVIKKEVIKNNMDGINNFNGQNESGFSPMIPQEFIRFHDQALHGRPSLPLKTTEDQIKRAQSQGNRPGEGKRGKSLNRGSPFVRETRAKEDLFVGQKVFSAKSIIQFQNLLGRPINMPIQLQNIGKENSGIKPIEMKESKEIQEFKDNKETKVTRIRGSSPLENKILTKETHENEQNELREFDDSRLVKESKDLYEFSFSKNFYKDKPSTAIPTNITTLENEKVERNQLSILKGSISSEKQYLKSKGKNFVNSDVKKKFSLVRTKQTQG